MKYTYSYTPEDSEYLDDLLMGTGQDDMYTENTIEEDLEEEPDQMPDYDEDDENDALAMDLLGYTSRRRQMMFAEDEPGRTNQDYAYPPSTYNNNRYNNNSAYSNNTSIQRTIAKESAGNSYAVSSKGARGLMQIMPVALKDFNMHTGNSYSMDDMFDPQKNIQVGSWYKQQRIPQMLKQYGLPVTDFNVEAAYNGGIGRVVDYYKRGKALPAETRNYVTKQFGGEVDPVSMAVSQGVKMITEGINSYKQVRDQSKQFVNEGVNYLSDLANQYNSLPLFDEEEALAYAQQGFTNPYQQQQFVLNVPQQQSVIPQFVVGGGNLQSATQLQPQPDQNLWQKIPFSLSKPSVEVTKSSDNIINTPLKLLGNVAGKLIPQVNSAPVAAGIATSVFNMRNAAQQRNELMDKMAKRNDKAKSVNSSKGLEYKPLYVQHGGRSQTKYKFQRG